MRSRRSQSDSFGVNRGRVAAVLVAVATLLCVGPVPFAGAASTCTGSANSSWWGTSSGSNATTDATQGAPGTGAGLYVAGISWATAGQSGTVTLSLTNTTSSITLWQGYAASSGSGSVYFNPALVVGTNAALRFRETAAGVGSSQAANVWGFISTNGGICDTQAATVSGTPTVTISGTPTVQVSPTPLPVSCSGCSGGGGSVTLDGFTGDGLTFAKEVLVAALLLVFVGGFFLVRRLGRDG